MHRVAWNNTNLLLCSSIGQKSNGDLTGLKSRCSRAAFLSEGFRQKPFPCLHSFAHGYSSLFSQPAISSPAVISLILCSWEKLYFKGFVIRLSPWIIQNPLPSRSLVLITSAKSLLPCKIAFTESETLIMGDCSAYKPQHFRFIHTCSYSLVISHLKHISSKTQLIFRQVWFCLVRTSFSSHSLVFKLESVFFFSLIAHQIGKSANFNS